MMRIIGLWTAGIMLLCCGCGDAPQPEEPVQEGGTPILVTGPYRLRPGDKIRVDFFFERELSSEARVRPDGYVALPLLGDVMAASRTPDELDIELTEAYARYVKQPELAVMLEVWAPLEVYIAGEVPNPGRAEFRQGMRASQAIISRGGFNDDADEDDVVLLRQIADGTVVGRKLDLSGLDNVEGPEDDPLLQPNDVIVVPPTAIARVGMFVNSYFTDTFMPVASVVSNVYSTVWFQKQLNE